MVGAGDDVPILRFVGGVEELTGHGLGDDGVAVALKNQQWHPDSSDLGQVVVAGVEQSAKGEIENRVVVAAHGGNGREGGF